MNGRFIVEWGQAGWRLDQAVAVVSGCSRSQVKRLMEGGCLTVNGSGAKAHLKLAVGQIQKLTSLVKMLALKD